MNKTVIILGAGISGLATAWWLREAGCTVTLLEKRAEPGGSMDSRRIEGYLVDYGPNSGLMTSPLIEQLIDGAGIRDELRFADVSAGARRYILRNGAIHPLPMSLGSFLRTPLFSMRAKLRSLGEPFIGRSSDGYNQSIADFVRRRLGQEFLDYAINPFVAGVFAGNPETLSVKSAFPRLYRLEEEYGGLIRGAMLGARERKRSGETSKQKARMFSFLGGMQRLPEALAASFGDDVKYEAEVTGIQKTGGEWQVRYNHENSSHTAAAGALVSTAPAYVAANLVEPLDADAARHLREIHYPPVMMLYLGYNVSQIGQPLDGFGFLIPEKEKRCFLGAIWSSVLFPDRAPDARAGFTLFVGGARSPELFDQPEDKLVEAVIKEFSQIMKIDGDPVFQERRLWHKAIPQYNLGYIEHARAFERFEAAHKGVYLSGNYRGGISVADCIKSSREVADGVIEGFGLSSRSTSDEAMS